MLSFSTALTHGHHQRLHFCTLRDCEAVGAPTPAPAPAPASAAGEQQIPVALGRKSWRRRHRVAARAVPEWLDRDCTHRHAKPWLLADGRHFPARQTSRWCVGVSPSKRFSFKVAYSSTQTPGRKSGKVAAKLARDQEGPKSHDKTLPRDKHQGGVVLRKGFTGHVIRGYAPYGAAIHLAVGEPFILLAPPSASLLEHLLEEEGGAAERQVSPTWLYPTEVGERVSVK